MIKEGYKEIEIKKKLNFEEDEEPIETVTVTLDDNEQEEVMQPVEDETPPAAPIVKDEKKRSSRAKERIRQLVNERDAERDAREAMEQRIADLESKLTSGNKDNKEALKTSLEAQVKNILDQMVVAVKAGEAEETVRLTDELTTVRMRLAAITSELKNVPEATKEQPIRKQQVNEVPEKALEWVDEHPEFKTDPEFNRLAMIVNNQLLREGFDSNDDEFYEELNTRLAKRFPEVFGIAEKKQVESIKNTDSSEKEPDVTKAPSKARTIEQTVSGSSRSAPAKNIQARKSNTVELTREDLADADRLGLTPKQMARRLLHIEKNKQYGGYVPIMYSKDE